jgi:hypothetical protein
MTLSNRHTAAVLTYEAPFEAEAHLYNTGYKDSVHTAKKTQHFSITKINLFMFEEIIPVYSENHTKLINTLCGQNAVVDF